MSGYISRQVAIRAIKDHINFVNTDMEGYNMARLHIMELIEVLPSADVRENVRGEWIVKKDIINCSVCKRCSWSKSYEDLVRSFNFCPNCGADMRGEL